MIKATRTDDRELIINAELIIEIQETPDTIITMSNGKKVLVKEKAAEIVSRVIEYRQKIMNGIEKAGEV
ncbi:flagellar FlbD family protein [Halanaerobium sp. Z-7514]|uniref:Flagellar FlbD family protein n=1 Tax=Halanaerobium polyolivorans TaxID=2886943 RepID=A0AAW4X075_9FIRM|nr:flagellar FlbD family protein [Halanaerobium polyolivorans]MCC3145200.1 flagellar FlbD family protein [Halanaerobium polyolivorans]